MAVDRCRNSQQGCGGSPFKKGRSGNPAGVPPGARKKATLAAEALFDSEAVGEPSLIWP